MTRHTAHDSKARNTMLIFAMGMCLILYHHQLLLESNVFSTAKSTEDLRKRVLALESGIHAFPHTKFTPHIENDILPFMDEVFLNPHPRKPYNPKKKCLTFRMVIPEPYSAPVRIECRNSNYWCTIFQMIFSKQPSRILPYNVTVGITLSDFERWDSFTYGICLGSSSESGEMTMNNFQDAQQQGSPRNVKAHGKGWTFATTSTLPWEQRQTTPVFRGHPRLSGEGAMNRGAWVKDPTLCPDNVADMGHRAKAAMFSLQHPDLLDAAVSDPGTFYSCNRFHKTNGMDQLYRVGKYNDSSLPPLHIPPLDYHANYQTALVLGGVGAAFRTSRHLAAGQAVILQDFKYQEWFVKYMTPYQNYIPLQRDLSDLKQVLEWVRDHPDQVKKIAENGKHFYWDYLDFDHTEEHWYELLWKLSLRLEQYGPTELQHGTIEQAWGDTTPVLLERTDNGEFVAAM